MDHEQRRQAYFFLEWFFCLTVLSGVSAPIVGTTSLENLMDLIGMLAFIQTFILTYLIGLFLGAVNVALTDEEAAYLAEPYNAQAVMGHA